MFEMTWLFWSFDPEMNSSSHRPSLSWSGVISDIAHQRIKARSKNRFMLLRFTLLAYLVSFNSDLSVI